ncbi:hypothetical protein LJC33_08935, partial [Eubacteriales bacterium OttesenSCG-928-N13]|nr:hypothetical protein [Eubacteriales bacterium OttesenSCG-928-N13]
VLMAGISGASGLSILMQNLARLRPLGLPWHRLVLGKLAQGLTSMLLCGLQVRIWSHPFAPSRNEVPAFIWAFALAAIALALVGVGITLIPPADAHKQ